jgi:two-component system, NarL family, response regulator NreC
MLNYQYSIPNSSLNNALNEESILQSNPRDQPYPTIVIADDHAIVREGLRAALGATQAYQIVGEAADGLTTVRMVERLQPNFLIVDLMMPIYSGLEVARQIRQRLPQTMIIILSMLAEEAYVLEALQVGVMGYVLKTAHVDEVCVALREAQQGRRYLSPPLSERAIDVYAAQARAQPADPISTLTAREREVLVLAAQGYTNAIIGSMLSISPRTVDTHRTRIMRKLDVHTQAELARFARKHRLLAETDE